VTLHLIATALNAKEHLIWQLAASTTSTGGASPGENTHLSQLSVVSGSVVPEEANIYTVRAHRKRWNRGQRWRRLSPFFE
jgi:hypothetical protein